MKASTSQWARRELRTPAFAWQQGYGVFSLRDDDASVVHRDVLRQPEHHAAGTTVAAWERSSATTPAAPSPNPPPGG